MKLAITMNNEDIFTLNTDTNDFNNLIEKISSKCDGFLLEDDVALNIRQISSIQQITD